MSDYKVALEVYNGPLDLLLFLIRREEIDIYDIPIARITHQYVQYVEVLSHLDPEVVGEFLVLAATLMEIKSRTLLPTPPVEEADEEIADPRLELVRQLLEYKKYKDAARSLEGAADEQSLKHPRHPVLPVEPEDEVELDSLEIWDLFEAFRKLLEQTGKAGGVHQIPVDETPIALHAEDIVDSLQRAGGSQPFENIFSGRTKAEMIGLFLALLELIRQKRIRATQDRPFSPILIQLLDATPLDEVDDLEEEYRAVQTRFAGGEAVGSSAGEGSPVDLATENDEVDGLDEELSEDPEWAAVLKVKDTLDDYVPPDGLADISFDSRANEANPGADA